MKTLPKYRNRLLEALIYFSGNVKHPTKMMMYKMLAELDFRHFTKAGIPVTDLEYETWEMGPVPAKLHREITIEDDVVLPPEFKDSLVVSKDIFEGKNGKPMKEFAFHPKRKPNLKTFSQVQRDILQEVIDIYKEVPAWMASEASHERNTPWYRAKIALGFYKIINYIDFVDLKAKFDKETAREKISEMKAYIDNYGTEGGRT
jgi:uncharacterized phage-associated protein